MENPARPLSEIARKLGKSRAYVGKVRQKMEQDGTILGYSTAVNPKAIGAQCFHLRITAPDLEAEKLKRLAIGFQRVHQCLQFSSLDHVLHGEFDFLATVMTTDAECLCRFKKMLLENGVEGFEFVPVSKSLIKFGHINSH